MTEPLRNLVIIIAASGAAGKTTTTQTFAMGDPQEFHDSRPCKLKAGWEERRVYWTLYDNCAVSGNHHSGTDANNGPWMVREGMFEGFKHRRIVIVDGYTSSPQWAEMCNAWDEEHWPEQELVVLIVHIDLPVDEVLKRLSQRRSMPLEEVRQTMRQRVNGNVKRPIRLMNHFDNMCELETHLVTVGPHHSPEDIVGTMDEAVEKILGIDPSEDFHLIHKVVEEV